MKTIKRLFKNKKGIDTILAALLMVVIVVVASVMVYAWSTGLLGGLLVTPTTGKEALSLEQTSWSTNNTQAVLYIRNVGSASVLFTSYYVKDSAGNQWAKTAWTGSPPLGPPVSTAPNALAITSINIGSLSGATLTPSGASFGTFNGGSSYTIVIITTRNNQFTFTVIR
jgi:hypothetical protein